jgi:hypothetical protein
MSFKNTESQLKNYVNDVFIETGTYYGETAKIATTLGFKKVITIELQEHLQKIAKQTCNGLNIDFYLGDSPRILNDILPKIDSKITFWLDAHIDNCNIIENITPNIRKCPLIEELEIIKTSSRNDHVIIIDDIRLFGANGYWGEKINLKNIIDMIKNINDEYTITTIDGYIENDIIVAQIV